MSSTSSESLGFPKLGEENYPSWSKNMKAKMMEKSCYMVVSGEITGPTGSLDLYGWLQLKG